MEKGRWPASGVRRDGTVTEEMEKGVSERGETCVSSPSLCVTTYSCALCVFSSTKDQGRSDASLSLITETY
jgi:hypothetical protein